LREKQRIFEYRVNYRQNGEKQTMLVELPSTEARQMKREMMEDPTISDLDIHSLGEVKPKTEVKPKKRMSPAIF